MFHISWDTPHILTSMIRLNHCLASVCWIHVILKPWNEGATAAIFLESELNFPEHLLNFLSLAETTPCLVEAISNESLDTFVKISSTRIEPPSILNPSWVLINENADHWDKAPERPSWVQRPRPGGILEYVHIKKWWWRWESWLSWWKKTCKMNNNHRTCFEIPT